MQRIVFAILSLLVAQAVAYAEDEISRGRYLSLVAGCNDCHTSGFSPSAGNIPESEWLKGDAMGWRGPWGTTYPINLRNLVAKLSKDQFLQLMKNSKARPPMPTYVTKNMTSQDLGAIYTFIHSLGAAGVEVPAGLPPGVEPTTPYILFEPIVPGKK